MITRNTRTGGLLIVLAILLVACQTPPGEATPTTGESEELSFADEMATSRVESLEMLQAARTATALVPTPTPRPTVPGQTPTAYPTFPSGPTSEPLPVAEIDLPSPFNGVVPLGAIRRLGQGTLELVRPSPDGEFVAVGGSIGVTVYDTAGFEQVWYGRIPAGIEQLEWSPDSGRIAAGLGDGSLIVWENLNGSRLFRITGAGANSLDWSPDGERLVTSSRGGIAEIWNAESGVRLAIIDWHDIHGSEEPPHGIGWTQAALSPDGRLVATTYEIGGGDASMAAPEIDIWNAETGAHIRTLMGTGSLNVYWSPDGHLIAAGGWIWDVDNGETLAELSDLGTELHGLFWSPDGRWLAGASWFDDGDSVIFDVEKGTALAPLIERERFIAWSPDSTRYATSARSEIIIRDLGSNQERIRISGVNLPAVLSPDWQLIYGWVSSGWSREQGNSLAVWDTTTGEQLTTIVTGTGWVQSLSWSPDGAQLVTGSVAWHRSDVIIWDTQTGEAVEAISPDVPDNWWEIITEVAWSPDGRLIAIGGRGGVDLWEVESSQTIGRLAMPSVSGLAWSPDAELIGMGVSTEYFTVQYADSGDLLFHSPVRDLANQLGAVLDVDWSPDGSMIATGMASIDSATVLWDAASGERINTLYDDQHTAVNSVAFSPDGTLLASSGLESYDWGRQYFPDVRPVVTVWDVQSGTAIIRLREPTLVGWWGYENGITSVAWSPDGTMIAAAYGTPKAGLFGLGWSPGGPSPVVVWDVASGERLHIFYGHTSDVQDVAFSPDGSLLASGSLDGTVILWDVSR